MEEHFLCLAATIVSAFSYVLLGLYNAKYLPWWFPGAGFVTTDDIMAKYAIPLSIHNSQRTFGRLLMLPVACSSFGYLCWQTRKSCLFGKSFYLATMIMNVATNIWIWTFSTERLTESLIMMTTCAICDQYKFVYACFKGLPKHCRASRKVFHWCVVETLGFTAISYTWTVVMSSAGALAYEKTLREKTPRPGICNIITSSTIGILYFGLCQLAWMTIDLLLYPKVTKDVKIVYPYIIFLLGGMLCQSYDHVTGLQPPLAITVALIILALIGVYCKSSVGRMGLKYKSL